MSGVDMQAQQTTASRVVDASPEAIFDLLTDPTMHTVIDGSDTVHSTSSEGKKLELGSRFGMSMTMKFLPYRIGSTVVEYEPNRRIAWQHFGKHRWRYELEPVDGSDGQQTMVTETFDWSTSIAPKVIELAGYPKQHLGNIERTLDNLAAHFA